MKETLAITVRFQDVGGRVFTATVEVASSDTEVLMPTEVAEAVVRALRVVVDSPPLLGEILTAAKKMD